MRYTIESDVLRVTVDSLGAELVSAVGSDGFEYIWQADEKYWDGHSPLLFPVCGQLLGKEYSTGGVTYKMGGHGFARDFEFSPTRVEKSELVLTLKSSEETRRIYPFDFTLEARFAVSESSLTVDFTVKNEGDVTMPYMLGWHPGFNLDGAEGAEIGDFKLSFNCSDTVTWYPLQHGCFVRPFGEDYSVPDGEYFLCEEEIYENDTMIFVGTGERAVLSSEGEGHDVDLTWSKNLPYFCIWKAPDSAARYICLEPWSDVPADGEAPENFDVRKMSRLAAGGSEVYSYDVKFC